MKMQARLYVESVTKSASGYHKASLRAVSRGEHNKAWASATPTANLDMTVNADAAQWFEENLGKELAVTFEPRPADELPA